MKALFLSLVVILLASSAMAQSAPHTVLLRYYDVKNALTKDDFDSARSAAHALSQAANAALPTSAANVNATRSVGQKLRTSILKLERATDIEAMRSAFMATSNAMREYVPLFHASEGDTAYVAFCTMKKAYWLSDSQEIRNPYYGRKMLFCGQRTACFVNATW